MRVVARALAIAAVALIGPSAGAAAPQSAPRATERPAPRVSVQAMVDAAIANDRHRVNDIAAQLKSQARPLRGNRHKARDINERGLALWQRQRYDEAAA